MIQSTYRWRSGSDSRTVTFWRTHSALRAEIEGVLVWLRTPNETRWRSNVSASLSSAPAEEARFVGRHPVPELSIGRGFGAWERRYGTELGELIDTEAAVHGPSGRGGTRRRYRLATVLLDSETSYFLDVQRTTRNATIVITTSSFLMTEEDPALFRQG